MEVSVSTFRGTVQEFREAGGTLPEGLRLQEVPAESRTRVTTRPTEPVEMTDVEACRAVLRRLPLAPSQLDLFRRLASQNGHGLTFQELATGMGRRHQQVVGDSGALGLRIGHTPEALAVLGDRRPIELFFHIDIGQGGSPRYSLTEVLRQALQEEGLL